MPSAADVSQKTSPCQPILLVFDQSKPFNRYLTEILDVEGYFAREELNLTGTPLTAETLKGRAAVILASVELDASQIELLADFVAEGGNLIACKPPLELSETFGLKPSVGINRRMRNQLIQLDGNHPLADGVTDPVLQFHGDADLFEVEGAQILAWLSVEFDRHTRYPAVATVQSPAGGKAAIFTYDLAASTVRFHQGQADRASDGLHPDSDADDRWIPNDLFVKQLDSRLKFIPQADVHQDLLVRILNWMSTLPLPRIWYFPNGAPAITFINGDSDEMVLDDYLKVVETVERFGGSYTLYLLQEHYPLVEPELQRSLRERGHCLGHHLVLDWLTSIDDAKRVFDDEFAGFQRRYGYTPMSNRGHCLIWPGWTKLPEWLAKLGVRMDQNFIPRRHYRHGYINGSALPVKFIDSSGTLLDVYEQNTQITDDGSEYDEKFFVSGYDRQEILDIARRMLDDCIQKYNGVYQPSFHPHLTVERVMWLLEAVVRWCWERDIQMIGGDQWAQFNDARRDVTFGAVRWDMTSGELSFDLRAGSDVEGLPLLIPAMHGDALLTSISCDGRPTKFEHRFFKSMRYAMLNLNVAAGEAKSVVARFERPAVYSPTAASIPARPEVIA